MTETYDAATMERLRLIVHRMNRDGGWDDARQADRHAYKEGIESLGVEMGSDEEEAIWNLLS